MLRLDKHSNPITNISLLKALERKVFPALGKSKIFTCGGDQGQRNLSDEFQTYLTPRKLINKPTSGLAESFDATDHFLPSGFASHAKSRGNQNRSFERTLYFEFKEFSLSIATTLMTVRMGNS